jgi:AraC-like DNA-binding protein
MNREARLESFYSTCPPDWSAGVVHAGYEYCEPGHRWQGLRDHFLLHYVCQGTGTVRTQNREERLTRGDAFLFSPGEYLDYRADDTDPWYYLWVGFRGIHARDLVDREIRRGGSPVLSLPFASEITDLFSEMIALLRERPDGAMLQVTGLLYLLLGRLIALQAKTAPIRTTAGGLVAEAETFVLQNYQRDITVHDVIRHIGVDRSHFGRVFRRETGRSIRDFLIETRMERAHRMIEETDLAVRAVAASVGYRNYASFERRFHSWFGYAPTTIRRNPSGSAQAGSE